MIPSQTFFLAEHKITIGSERLGHKSSIKGNSILSYIFVKYKKKIEFILYLREFRYE